MFIKRIKKKESRRYAIMEMNLEQIEDQADAAET